ncbi:hypothetical protein JCM5353_005837 [Sporobolomyces roseus]
MTRSIPDEGYYLTSDNITDYYTWVEVDGKPLQVYGIEEKENKIFGYIEAQEGKQFVVCLADLRTTPPEQSFCTRAFVDGAYCNGQLTHCTSSGYATASKKSWRCSKLLGKKTSHTTIQPLIFSKLELTDDDDLACNDEEALKALGTVQVVYRRINNVRTCANPEVANSKYSSAQTQRFHEKAKKAQVSHQATFGAEVTRKAAVRRTSFSWADAVDPLETYEFRYRSRQLLQLEGFIPDSPEPSSEPSPSPVPQVAASPSPARAPASPIASTSATAPRPSGERLVTVKQENDRLARLKEELESLDRQERIAALRREIAELEGGASSPTSSSIRKIKADPDDQRDLKRVKREAGEASPLSQASGSGRGKGKGKEKADVIVLSDSD